MNSCAVTDIGQIRSSNQDFVYATDAPLGQLENFYLVADGMGGHQGGGFASRYAVERMVEEVAQSKDPGSIRTISQAIDTVNQELYKKSSAFEDLKGMGTTMVAATISEGILYVANIGDSRLYVVGEDIRQITRDHSWVEEMIARGKITRDSDFFRQNKNVITRAVGVKEEVTADFFEVELQHGEKVLLCSDGLTNMVSNEEICQVLNSGKSCQEAALCLIRRSNAHGGRDNISVIVVDPEMEEVRAC